MAAELTVEKRLDRLENDLNELKGASNRSWTLAIDGTTDELHLELEGEFDVAWGIHVKTTGTTARVKFLGFEGNRLVYRSSVHNCIEHIRFRMASVGDVPRRVVANGAHISGPYRD